MSIFHQTRQWVIEALEQICQSKNLAGVDFSKVTIEAPKDKTHGDLSTNAAMVCAKAMGANPRALAEALCELLKTNTHITTINIAGPGFINFCLDASLWLGELNQILSQGTNYGDSTLGQQQEAMVEFVSANPTGPIHAGHGRNAILGDAISALLEKVGYKVYREYLVNDAGGQVDALGRSVHLRYCEALGKTLPEDAFAGDLYPGDYLIPIGQKLADELGTKYVDAPESQWLEEFRVLAVREMLELIKVDLGLLGVVMDNYCSEIETTKKGMVDEALKTLEELGDVYIGTLEKPKGHNDDEWEERPQTLFRATKYGDDTDRALKKSNGSWTYFAGDMGYHYDKFKRGFHYMVNVFGADHAGYVKRISAAVAALTQGKAHFEIKVSQMVNFMDNGQPVRMSKRSGTFITVRDVIERVGRDATRYMMISRHNDMALDFDFAKVVEQSRDNPIFYIQYAHARICSVMRHAQNIWPDCDAELLNADLSLLNHEAELDMLRVLSQWPKQVEVAALVREPHRLANFLYDVAGEFHSLWNKGKDNVELRFIDVDNKNVTLSRLALLKGIANVLQSGLILFNITPLEELRA